MEQRRIELTLARLQSTLHEKLQQIEKLKILKQEKAIRLKEIKDLRCIKLEFYQSMKEFAEISIDAELTRKLIEDNKERLQVAIKRNASRQEIILIYAKQLAQMRFQMRAWKDKLDVVAIHMHDVTQQRQESLKMLQEDIDTHYIEQRYFHHHCTT